MIEQIPVQYLSAAILAVNLAQLVAMILLRKRK